MNDAMELPGVAANIGRYRGRLAWLGGSATVAAALAFLALQVVLFVVIHAALAAQGAQAARAIAHVEVSRDVRQLLQGVNEVVVTDGASASKAVAGQARARIDAALPTLDLGSAATSKWHALRGRIDEFLERADFGRAEVETLVAMGRLTADLDLWAAHADVRSREIQEANRVSERTTRWLFLGVVLASLAGTLSICAMF